MTSGTESKAPDVGEVRGWLDLSARQRVHHSVVICSDLDRSLRFYRDGLGMDVVMEQESATGPDDASEGPHIVFLGSEEDQSAGMVELIKFDGGVEPAPENRGRAYGFYALTFYVDVDATLDRLAAMGAQPELRTQFEAPGGAVVIVMIRDPDGVLVELIGVAGGPGRTNT